MLATGRVVDQSTDREPGLNTPLPLPARCFDMVSFDIKPFNLMDSTISLPPCASGETRSGTCVPGLKEGLTRPG
jgi:hypothetical protein